MTPLKLRPHQEKAVDFLLSNQEAFLIATMGSGKTIATLEAIRRLYQQKKVRGVLIVAPLRVTKLVWPLELDSWREFSGLSYNVLHGKNKSNRYFDRKKIYLINYEGLAWLYELIRDTKVLLFDTIVLDESTKIKAFSSTKRLKMLRGLGEHMKRKICLTGTPMPSSHLDLFNQVRFLDGGERLGNNMSKFRIKHFYQADYKGFQWKLKEGEGKKIEDKISDLTLTLSTEKAEGLKGITEVTVDLTLPKGADKIYKQMERQLFAELDTQRITAFNSAVKVGKLMQITSGFCYDGDKKTVFVHNGKMEALKKFLFDHNKENVIIFYNFIAESDMLKKAGINHFLGKGNKDERGTIERWNKGKIKVLAAHPQSCGHGLNLQYGGHTVLWLTLCFSRELYDQANARLYRSGQKNHVGVYRFITKGTVDEVTATTLERRGDAQKLLVETLIKYRRG